MTDSTETILFETSPFGTLDGIVEHDGRVVYFYLNERENEAGTESRFGTRACWVRNLERGPMVFNKADMAAGKSPLLPRNDCLDPTLLKLPESGELEIVWFEEGNGAALIETELENKTRNTIAVIPPWSGVDGFQAIFHIRFFSLRNVATAAGSRLRPLLRRAEPEAILFDRWWKISTARSDSI